MVYKGTGGPPPAATRSSRGNAPFGFHLYEDVGAKRKKVGLFRIGPGEKNVPFLFLDTAHPDVAEAPSIRIHRDFRYRGTFGNSIICVSYRDSGCPMDKALEAEHRCFPNCSNPCPKYGKMFPVQGGWRWVATGIKMQPFKFTRGPLAGKTLDYQRCMLLVPEKQYPTFVAFRENFVDKGGLRGKVFNVSREDDQRSSKIGTAWIPVGEMSDEEMLEKFDEAARLYGLPPERYIQPYDYEKVLRELSDEEMLKAAQHVAADRGIKLDDSEDSSGPGSDSESADNEDESEQEIPF